MIEWQIKCMMDDLLTDNKKTSERTALESKPTVFTHKLIKVHQRWT